MDPRDRQKIYSLLAQYFPNARQLRDKKTLTAWGLALEKFPYDAVKNAVVNYAIGNKFFPDLADITAGLIPEETPAPPVHSPSTQDSLDKQARWVGAYRALLHNELERRGLPEFTGITGAEYSEWVAMCARAGLDLSTLLEVAYRQAVCGEGGAPQ